MRAVSLLLHDIVSRGDLESSGFLVPGATRYKLDRDEFERHLAAIARVISREPDNVLALLESGPADGKRAASHFYLTFDDGGSSAWPCTAGLLNSLGWKAHFLITTDYIGGKRFVGKEEIRALRNRGHVIGSHSASHPARMSACSWQKMLDEWETSIKALSDILGEPVTVASVPGGYYSRKVAESAARSGIRVLFTSEPTTRISSVGQCLVLGRYSVLRGMSTPLVERLVTGKGPHRVRQYLSWNVKKAAKHLGGELWLAMRSRILR